MKPESAPPISFTRYRRAAGTAAVSLGAVVLLGWALDLPLLTTAAAGRVAVNPLTAVGFVALGLGLLSGGRRAAPTAPIRGDLCALFALAAGLLVLASYVSGSAGPDQWLFGERLEAEPGIPNRMAPNTAFCFVLLGAALLLLDRGGRGVWQASELLAGAAGLVALLALIGYLYGVPWSYGVATFIPMALPTAAGFLVVATGVFAARPAQGVMATIAGDGPGGSVARHLLPPMVLALLVIGGLRLEGERRDFYGSELGVALYTTAIIAILAILIVWTARALERGDVARRRLEAERERVFTLSRDMLAVAAMDGRVRRANPAWKATLGFSPEQVAGSSVLDYVHPDDRAVLEAGLADLARGSEVASLELRWLAADQTYRWVLWSATPVPAEGVFFATVRDVTQRRLMEEALVGSRAELEKRVQERTAELLESEERARLIVDTALDAVITMDDRGRIVGWNAQAEASFGWTRQEAVGRDLSETIIPLRHREAHRLGLRRFLRTGRGTILGSRIELVALSRGGREFPVELAISPVQRAGRWSFNAFVRDISRRKDAEQALRDSEDRVRQANLELERRVLERTAQLETANKELEAFSYSVSHDLRAPLRHVQGYVEMLRSAAGDGLSEKARRYLKVISDASSEMGQLIDDLLAFSRMGRGELREGEVDLDAMLAEIRRGLEIDTRGRDIEWRLQPLPRVLGDAAMIRQVLANLVGNAVKYTRGRDPAVIEIGSEPEEDGRAVLFVRDNGAGFDMQYAHKLFGVFQRLHRAEEFEGTGIGLATVRRIVARHGGRTWAEGEPGRGATFRFTLRRIPDRDMGERDAA